MKNACLKVRQWGRDRNIVYEGQCSITKEEYRLAQIDYTLKEYAELVDAIADNDVIKIKDAIGDIVVTLIVGNSSMYSGFEDTIERIYNLPEYSGSNPEVYPYNDYENELISSLAKLQTEIMFLRLDISKGSPSCSESYSVILKALNNVVRLINRKYSQIFSIKGSLYHAYEEIKDRTGKVVDGQFIKD